MDHQTGAKLRFEPRRLRRHDITRIGDIHQLLHRNGIQSQGNLHLTAIHTAFQFTQAHGYLPRNRFACPNVNP